MLDRLENNAFRHFNGELGQLHQNMVAMATLVLEQIQLALQTFRQPDPETDAVIRQKADQVDQLKHRTHHIVTTILFQNEPFTDNLHAVIAFSKMDTDVERLADEAARISLLSDEVHCSQRNASDTQMLHDVSNMGRHACDLLQEAVNILTTLDKNAAKKLLAHSNLDNAFCSSFRILTSYALENTRNMHYIVKLIMVLKSLESIGHHAHNLAEDVIYIASDKNTTHQTGPVLNNAID